MIRLASSCLAALACLMVTGVALPTVAHAAECACEVPWSLPRGPEPEVPDVAVRGVVPDAAIDAAADAAPPDALPLIDAPVAVSDAAPAPDAAAPTGPRLMPTNGRIFIEWPGVADTDLTLGIDGGGSIDFTVEVASAVLTEQRWVIPAGPLPPGRTVVLAGGGFTLRFDVGAEEDETPPVVRGLESQGAILQGDCGPHVGAEIRALGLELPDTLDDVLYEIDVRRLGPPPEERMTFILDPKRPILGIMDTVDPVKALCLTNVPFAQTSWDYAAKVRVLDVAGNAADHATKDDGTPGSLLETEFRFADNPARGCGCRVAGRGAGTDLGSWAWIGLALCATGGALLRRRRA